MMKFTHCLTAFLLMAGVSVWAESFVENFNGSKIAPEWQEFWKEKCDAINSVVKNNTLTIKGLVNAKTGANASYDRFIGEISGDFELRCEMEWKSEKSGIDGGYSISVSNDNGESFFRVGFAGSEDGKSFTVTGRAGHQSKLLKSTPVKVNAPAKGLLTVKRTKSIYVIAWNGKEAARVESDNANACMFRIAVRGVNPGSLSMRKLSLKSVK